MVDNVQKKYKDPDEVEIFTIDWSADLSSGETISTSSFSVDSGLTNDGDTNGDTTTSITLSGGTDKTVYNIRNDITTSLGRTRNFTCCIEIKEN